MSATIHLKLFATLRPYTPDNAQAYPVEKGVTVSELVRELAIPPELVKLIFINSRRESLESTLNPGDQVGLFPPVGGG